MYQTSEQLIAFNKANLEVTIRFAAIALEGTERMLEVQLKAAKRAFAEGVMQVKALAEVKDVEQLAQLNWKSASCSKSKLLSSTNITWPPSTRW